MSLTSLDVFVVLVYLAAVAGITIWVSRAQRTGDDYFLAGRSMGGVPLAMSIMANQVSAVSLIGAPAFVAVRAGGGLVWLQYELAVPLAMLVLASVVLPTLRSVAGASIYAYLERRFDRRVRRVVAGSFVLARGLSLGVIVYASALVVSQSLGLGLTTSIVLVGGGSVLYTSIGGMAADVWSDVLQLVWLWVGIAVASAYLLQQHGLSLLAAVPADRLAALDVRAWGGTPDSMFGLAPMLVGGFFLYLSYYGCDQSQAQRLLAARSDDQARVALLLNGLFRFPVVFTYCGLGVLLAGALALDPAFAASMNGQAPDRLVPIFMMSYLPSGLRGLFVAAIAAAAMSSIDSALNSLAAVTLEDVAGQQTRLESVWVGRGVALAWGVFAVASAFVFARAGSGVLELINQIGSVFYGPVLAVFLLGILAPMTGANAALRGFWIGLAATALVGWAAPAVSWLWWNPIGFFAAAAGATSNVGRLGSLVPVTWRRGDVVLLGGMFVGMLLLLALAPLASSMLFGTTLVAPSP